MKRCGNCTADNADEAVMCANCGATLPVRLGAGRNWLRGDGPGCVVVVLAVLDFVFLPFALAGLWGTGEMGFDLRPPLWGVIAFYVFQMTALATIVYVYAAAVRAGAGPRVRPVLLAATILATLILGAATACDVGMMAKF